MRKWGKKSHRSTENKEGAEMDKKTGTKIPIRSWLICGRKKKKNKKGFLFLP